MRRTPTLLIVTLLCAALLGGCGGDTGEAKTNPVEAVLKDPLTSKQIKKALLTVDDMPSGYSEDPDLIGQEESEDEVTSGSPKCEEVMKTLDGEEDEKPVGKGEVGFAASEFGPFLMETVASQEGDKVEKAMDEFRDAFSSCTKFESTDGDGAVTKFTVAEMSFPELGDDTVAFKLTGSEDTFDLTFEFHMVAVRVDQNVVLLINFGIGKPMGAAKFEKLARLAVERISEAT